MQMNADFWLVLGPIMAGGLVGMTVMALCVVSARGGKNCEGTTNKD